MSDSKNAFTGVNNATESVKKIINAEKANAYGAFTKNKSDSTNECLDNDPEYAWAYYIRGQIYQQLERYDEAKADYDKANELLDKEK